MSYSVSNPEDGRQQPDQAIQEVRPVFWKNASLALGYLSLLVAVAGIIMLILTLFRNEEPSSHSGLVISLLPSCIIFGFYQLELQRSRLHGSFNVKDRPGSLREHRIGFPIYILLACTGIIEFSYFMSTDSHLPFWNYLQYPLVFLLLVFFLLALFNFLNPKKPA